MGRKKQIDTSMYFCPHTDCHNYGKVGPDNQIVGAGRYGKANTQLLRCKVCGRTFSVRRGTPLFGLKASEETFYDVIACLAEGNGISPHQRGGYGRMVGHRLQARRSHLSLLDGQSAF